MDLLEKLTRKFIRIGCTFKMCEGYETEPEGMITCHRCAALHRIIEEHPEMKEKIDRL